jgi:hypothetical protein
MGREELVLLARILARLGTEAESTVLSAIQYRSCCFPPPSLIRRSVFRGYVQELAKLAMDARVSVRLRPVRRVVGDFWGRRLALVCQGTCHELIAFLALVHLGLRGKHKDDYK